MKQNLLTFFSITIFSLFVYNTSAQQKLRVEKFLTDTIFSAISVADNGDVYAGTTSTGVVRFDKKDGQWKTWNGVLASLVKLNIRQMFTVNDSVWIGTSGYAHNLGVNAGINKNVLGGVHVMTNKNKHKKTYYMGASVSGIGVKNGPPTRNVTGICIDQYGTPWVAADYHDSSTYVGNNARYYFSPGSVAKFNWELNNFQLLADDGMPNPTGILIGSPNLNRENNYSFGKRKGCLSIASVNGEIWAGCNGYEESAGNINYAGIVRYDTDGNYLGKYDQNNTGIPFGLLNNSTGPWAIYQDLKGRVWIALPEYRGLAVLNTNNQWTYIGLPAILNGEQARANAITGDDNGNIFFGTNAGLLIYDGQGDFTDAGSYELWTMANGLSSNYIAGVAVGKDNVIWLATNSGVNKIIRGELTVYNLFNDIYTESILNNDLFRRVVAYYDSDRQQSSIDQDTLFIAADSTRATFFKFTGSDISNIRFRIKDGDEFTTDQDKYGKFEYRYLNDEKTDSLYIQYYHPSYIESLYTVSTQFNGKAVRLQVVDESATPGEVILDIPVKFVLPPVLMLHGLWSEGPTWEKMKEYLQTNGSYHYKSFEISTPSYPNDHHFKDNRIYVSKFLDELLKECSENRTSVGAADIVAHSMGGILSRLYLQEGIGSTVYAKNIHKLITINTPHSGSPLANIVEAQGDIFKWVVKKGAGDPTKGALGDLSLGKAPIDSLLNGPDLNKNIVPSHAIHSTTDLPIQGEIVWDVLRSIDITIPIISIRQYASGIFGCSYFLGLNNCFEKMYNGKHDLIVSDESQIGGLSSNAETYFEGYSHMEVYQNLPAISKVFELLRAKTTSGDFSFDGFHPARLRWDQSLGTQPARKMAETLQIESPGYGETFSRGDSVHIQIDASGNIARMMLLIGYENKIGTAVLESPDNVFRFKIPEDVLERMNYKVFGFTSTGDVFTDSSYITINPDPSIVLDSIKIKTNQNDDLKITIEDSISISIMGYYSDGIERELTYQPGISYSTLTNSVSLEDEGFVKGLIIGYDELTIEYNGMTDFIDLEVIPKKEYDTVKAAPLPVTFSGVSARFNGSEIKVEWSTASEQNNQYFEIEHSTNAQIFTPAGRVKATNFPNGSNYNFYHVDFVPGNNYYRIKQVDWDGKFSYSNTVIAIVNVQKNVVVYPNPVQDLLHIDFGSSGISSEIKSVRISNTYGQVLIVKNMEGSPAKATISLAGLPAGIYTLQIIDKQNMNIITEKIIKNR